MTEPIAPNWLSEEGMKAHGTQSECPRFLSKTYRATKTNLVLGLFDKLSNDRVKQMNSNLRNGATRDWRDPVFKLVVARQVDATEHTNERVLFVGVEKDF